MVNTGWMRLAARGATVSIKQNKCYSCNVIAVKKVPHSIIEDHLHCSSALRTKYQQTFSRFRQEMHHHQMRHSNFRAQTKWRRPREENVFEGSTGECGKHCNISVKYRILAIIKLLSASVEAPFRGKWNVLLWSTCALCRIYNSVVIPFTDRAASIGAGRAGPV